MSWSPSFNIGVTSAIFQTLGNWAERKKSVLSQLNGDMSCISKQDYDVAFSLHKILQDKINVQPHLEMNIVRHINLNINWMNKQSMNLKWLIIVLLFFKIPIYHNVLLELVVMGNSSLLFCLSSCPLFFHSRWPITNWGQNYWLINEEGVFLLFLVLKWAKLLAHNWS